MTRLCRTLSRTTTHSNKKKAKESLNHGSRTKPKILTEKATMRDDVSYESVKQPLLAQLSQKPKKKVRIKIIGSKEISPDWADHEMHDEPRTTKAPHHIAR